jgi:hypothetical protein
VNFGAPRTEKIRQKNKPNDDTAFASAFCKKKNRKEKNEWKSLYVQFASPNNRPYDRVQSNTFWSFPSPGWDFALN